MIDQLALKNWICVRSSWHIEVLHDFVGRQCANSQLSCACQVDAAFLKAQG